MTVGELIEILEDLDPEAQVHIMSQQSWPFENTLAGVAVREEFERDDEDGEVSSRADGTAPSDVFLCEGTQLRYGSKNAWNVMAT